MSSRPSSLPHEVYLSIFSHLTTADLLSASLVNRRWHHSSLSLLYAHLHLTSSTQLSLLHKYFLIHRHSRLIRNITLYRIDLTVQDKLTLVNECQNLISITLIKCTNLDSEFLKELVKANTFFLERFCIWGDNASGNNLINETGITDDLLTPMLEYCGNLRELRVCGAEITDDFLTNIASSMSDQLSSTSSSIDDGNECATSNENFSCTKDLTYTTGNEDSIIPSTNDNIEFSNNDDMYSSLYMPTTCPHLITLDLTECFNLTAFGVAELFSPQQLPKFHVLTLQYNPQNDLDLEFFEFLADNFKSHVFHINILNSKGRNKVLQTFARITKDLNILGKRKSNVRVTRRERKVTDDEILKIFGRESEVSVNENK